MSCEALESIKRDAAEQARALAEAQLSEERALAKAQLSELIDTVIDNMIANGFTDEQIIASVPHTTKQRITDRRNASSECPKKLYNEEKIAWNPTVINGTIVQKED